jgi:hypothetical protein
VQGSDILNVQGEGEAKESGIHDLQVLVAAFADLDAVRLLMF